MFVCCWNDESDSTYAFLATRVNLGQTGADIYHLCKSKAPVPNTRIMIKLPSSKLVNEPTNPPHMLLSM